MGLKSLSAGLGVSLLVLGHLGGKVLPIVSDALATGRRSKAPTLVQNPSKPDEAVVAGVDAAIVEDVLRPAVGANDTALSEALAGHKADEVPNPFEHPGPCGLAAPGGLCDMDGILSPEGRKKVADMLNAIRTGTHIKCPDGSENSFEVGVALVRKMDNDRNTTGKQFAAWISDRWGVGDLGCGNGVLIFLSLDDRYAHIKTASTSASRQVLTDAHSQVVVNNIKLLLQHQKYDDALLQAALQVKDALLGKWELPRSGNHWAIGFFIRLRRAFPVLLPISLVLAVVCIAVLCCVTPIPLKISVVCLRLVLTPVAWLLDCLALCRRRLRRGRRAAGLDAGELQQELDRHEFNQTACSICFVELPADGSSVSVLACRHRFHSACVDPWLAEHATCPVCRADVEAPPEEQGRPPSYQRLLAFHLSRLGRSRRGLLGSSSS